MTILGRSIKAKLTRLVLITIVAVLSVSSTLLLTYEVLNYRDATAQSLGTLADIVADNSAAIIIYDDHELAEHMLAGLHAEREIVAATLFDRRGMPYVTYPSDAGKDLITEIPEVDGVHMGARSITVVKPILQAGARVGTLVFRGNLQGTYQRILVYALLLVAIVATSSATALAISKLLQRRITEPLLALAEAARVVSRDKDFSIRARRVSDDELGELTDAFNTMLDQIALSNAALRQSEERFRTLADNIAQMAWMADASGTPIWFNRRWEQFVGTPPATGTHAAFLNALHHPDHYERVTKKWRAAVASGEPWEDAFPLRDRHGVYRWFLSHALPIRDGMGRVMRWFGTQTDITELREIQQQLRESRDEAVAASRAKDDFLARLSHELRTPLNPVLLLVSDTRRNQQLPPEVRADYESIRKHIELEARLIDDLLDLTSITHGKLALQRTRVDAHEVLNDAIATVRTDLESKSISMQLAIDPAPGYVLADATRLQQVFWNVLKNAAKFTPAGGAIHVTTCVDPGASRFVAEITDTGVGMNDEEIKRVFEPFAQGDHADERGSGRFGGLGLGLAISRMLMSLHGGTISASSGGPQCGSTITLELPLAGSAGGGATPAGSMEENTRDGSGPGRSQQVERVLLVEDHEPTLVTLTRLLTRRGYDVTPASSLTEARRLASEHRFTLLVSDIGLPDGTGYELMEEMRTQNGLRGIALTGFGMEADITRSREAGFRGHLTKPITVAALERALSAIATDGRPETPASGEI